MRSHLREELLYVSGLASAHRVSDPDEFWWLMDWLQRDASEFYHNRNLILDWFQRGCLYSLGAETYSDDAMKACNPDGVTHPPRLPVLCACEDGVVQILWVATPFRRMGMGSNMIEKLSILMYHGGQTKKLLTSEQTEDSLPFWQSVDLEEAANLSFGFYIK